MKAPKDILEHTCTEQVKHKIIILSDSKEKSKNKTKVQIKNPKQVNVWKIKVDDCFESLEKHCDFLCFEDKNKPTNAHFIELKSTLNSTKFKESIKQLKNSYSVISKQKAIANKLNQASFYIIAKKIIKNISFDSAIQIATKELKRKHKKSELFIGNSGHTITL